VNLTGGTTTLDIPVAATVEFAGGFGELYAASNLTKAGFGTLALSKDSPYSGTTTINVNGGTILLTDEGAARNTAVTVNVGGVLQLGDLGSTVNRTDRLSDTATLTLSGGTLALVGKAGEASGETLGTIALGNATTSTIQSIVSTVNTPAASSARWDITNVTRTANQGAMLNFQGLGVGLGSATANQIAFRTPGTAIGTSLGLDDGILPYAVISNPTGLEFATRVNATPQTMPFDNFLTPLVSGANYATDNLAAGATVNVKVTADQDLAASTPTVNAVLIVGPNVDLTRLVRPPGATPELWAGAHRQVYRDRHDGGFPNHGPADTLHLRSS
jgi:autotransporter-associated beta strand protein